ncbi:MAG TPA: carbohydrate ABC transporter permease [Anaerolineae bacterium]|nr:carbohydrate ABC transporter permease [Anaerolineae bacterium]
MGLLVFVTSVVFPFYWMFASSFKSGIEISGRAPVWVPHEWRLDAYQQLFNPAWDRYQDFGKNVLNSVKVALPTSILAVLLSTLGAYAIVRLQFKGKNFMLNSILMIYLFPGVLLIIPLFAMLAEVSRWTGIEIQDNLSILVLTYLAQTLPVAMYMLSNYFRTIPSEIEQAALIDGCSRFDVIWRIVLPLAVPALVSVGIYTFMIAWNEFLYAFVFLNSHDLFTIPIKINTIFNDPSPQMNVVMAASTVMTLPIVILFFGLQRYLSEGLSAGGVKG